MWSTLPLLAMLLGARVAHAQVQATLAPDAAPALEADAAEAPLASEPASVPPSHAAEVTRFTLDNGLVVVLAPQPGRGRAAVALSVDVGSREDPPGYRGLAHLTEHTFFEGAAYFETLERAGATGTNATTGRDRTLYFYELPASELRVGLWQEASRFGHLLGWLDEAMVARARAAVLHELDLREQAGGMGALAHFAFEVLYPEGHPYRNGLEQADDLAAIRLAHVQWFVQTHYGPERMTLAIAGDFDPDAARAMVTDLFAPLRRAAPGLRERGPIARIPEGEHVLRIRWPFGSRTCVRGWFVPEDAPVQDDRALDVLASHLSQELADMALAEDEFRTGYAQYSESELGAEFLVGFSLDPEADDAPLTENVEAAVRALGESYLDKAELTSLRDAWARKWLMMREDLGAMARHWAATGRKAELETPEQMAAEYAAVTPGDLHRAARWLTPDRRVALCATPNAHAPLTGRLRRHRFHRAKESR